MSDKNKNKKLTYEEKRKKLIVKSNVLRKMVLDGKFNTINEALQHSYMQDDKEITEFNTFNQWKELGFTIKKGSKAFLFWGQPKKATRKQKDKREEMGQDDENNNNSGYEFFPLCYLFANTQVVNLEETRTERNEEQSNEIEEPNNIPDLPF